MTAHAATSLRHVAALGLTGLAITMNTHAASERILFDFQASTNSSAWQIVNDDVMGGVSTSRFQILTNGGAVFSGVVSLENNGGFASVRSSPARHDLTGCGCFVIRLRGRRTPLQIHRAHGNRIRRAALPVRLRDEARRMGGTSAGVQGLRADLSRPHPDRRAAAQSGKVTSVGLLISEKQDGPFRLEIVSISAARQQEKPREP